LKRKQFNRITKKNKAADLEADLYNIQTCKAIAWDPDVTLKGQPKFYGDETLKGKYVCRYLDGQDRLQSVTVPTDWLKKILELRL